MAGSIIYITYQTHTIIIHETTTKTYLNLLNLKSI